MSNFHSGDLMVNNFWIDNIVTLLMYVGLIISLCIAIQIVGPQDGQKTEKGNEPHDNR